MNKENKKCQKSIWQTMILSFMVLIMCMVFMPLTVYAINVTTGTIGDNGGITWTYDEDTDTMTLKGKDSGTWGVDVEGEWYKVSVLKVKCPDVKKIIVEDLTIQGDASYFFSGLINVESIEFKKVDTSQVTSMNYMFKMCQKLTRLDVSGFDTSKVTGMEEMFAHSYRLTGLDLSNFDTSQVRNMQFMFGGCSGLVSLDVSSFETSKVYNMSCMFYGCDMVELDVSNFNTSNVVTMYSMFDSMPKLKSLDLSNFNTYLVKDMSRMFSNCKKLTQLNISGFDLTNIGENGNMNTFSSCRQLEIIQAPEVIPKGLEFQLAEVYLDEEGNKYSKLNSETSGITLTKESNPFSDVKKDSWQYEYVKFALNNNLMKGKETDADGNILFDPDKEMTRAEFVQTLYNKEGKPTVTYIDKFTDVTEGKWYTNAILWAAENNIVAGKGNGYFDVNGNITRQEMATILYKYANYRKYNTTWRTNLSRYTDENMISSWAKENMSWACAMMIMKGKGECLAPLENASRAECATMLCNFMTSYEGY